MNLTIITVVKNDKANLETTIKMLYLKIIKILVLNI